MIFNIFLGSLVLSIIHILLPNHWVPIAVLGKAEGWKKSKLRKVTVLAGMSHSLSTILIGFGVGLLGLKLTTISLSAMRLVGPSLFFVFGVLYLIAGIRDNIRKHPHRHIHLSEAINHTKKKATTAIATSMFFTPCLEIETYFFNASVIGWTGIAIVGVTYMSVTVVGLLFMTSVGRRGLEFSGFQFFEQYERHVLGVILMAVALFSYILFEQL